MCSYGRLLHSVWLITSVFNMNYQTASSFKIERKGGDHRFEEHGEFEKLLLEMGVEQRNMRGFLIIMEVPTDGAIVNFLR